MQALPGCIAALAVAVLFYIWRVWWQQRRRTLRRRVTFMLWVMAQQDAPPIGAGRQTRKIVTI
jgi:hypothetical protein